MMKTKILIVLVLAMAFVSTVQAIHAPVNGSFETVDDVDEGPLDKVLGADLYGIAGFVSISNSGWNVESHWVAVPDLDEIANCSVDNTIYTAEGDFSGVRTGDNYLRLSQDNTSDPGPGGVWQNLGAMVSGETYTIGADVFTWDNDPYAVLADYTVGMELYSGSIDPLNLLASNTISLVSTTNTLDINTGTLIAQVTAGDTSDLILRIFVANDPAGSYRGGVDNVRMPFYYQRANNPTPADGAENVGTLSEGGDAIDPVAASWSAPQIAIDLVTVIDNPDVTSYNVYRREAASADPNFSLVSSPTVASTSLTGMVPGTEYQWRVDAMLNNDANTIPGDIWTFTTQVLSAVIVTQPVEQIVDPGTAAVFAVDAYDPQGGELTYQWYISAGEEPNGLIALVDGGDISGADSSTLSIANVEPADEAYYRCKVSNGIDVYTDPAILTVKQLLLHLPFDGDLTDIAGGNDGSSIGGDPNYVAGIVDTGQAVEFFGLDNQAVYVTTAAYTSPSWTLSWWAKASPQATGTWESMLASGDTIGWDVFEFDRWGDGYALGLLNSFWGTTLGYDRGQWYSHVVTYDDVTKTVTWYLNNTEVLWEVTNYDLSVFDSEIYIGAANNTSQPQPYRGLMDDLRLYNYPMDATDIATLYSDVVGPFCVVRPAMDLSGDCEVTIDDLSLFVYDWLQCGRYPECITVIP
jgi:hypothetical protein